MDDRGRLYEVLRTLFPTELEDTLETVTDYLLDAGVTLPVRCKDCKHRIYSVFDGCYVCHHGGYNATNSDHFCAYGERRESG